MKRLAPLAALVILLTGCTATTAAHEPTSRPISAPASLPTPTPTPTWHIVAMPTATPSPDPAPSSVAPVSPLTAELTAQGPAYAMPAPAYYVALRAYSPILRDTSDGGLNVLSNVVCYSIKKGTLDTIRAGLKRPPISLSAISTLQLLTLIVAQYCPSYADRVGG